MAVRRKVALERTVQRARGRWPEVLIPTAQNRGSPQASHSSRLPAEQEALGGDCLEYPKQCAHSRQCFAPCPRAHSSLKQAVRESA
jgi:hypothetical protein